MSAYYVDLIDRYAKRVSEHIKPRAPISEDVAALIEEIYDDARNELLIYGMDSFIEESIKEIWRAAIGKAIRRSRSPTPSE